MIITTYQIKNKKTGRVYVGSTKDLDQRVRDHKSRLRRGKHLTHGLQEDYNIWGIDVFEFGILETGIPVGDRYAAEQKWIDFVKLNYGIEHLYNIQPFAGKTRGRPVSAETRRKQSDARKGRKLSDRARLALLKANIGREFSEETRKKISTTRKRQAFHTKNGNASLRESDVVEIMSLLESGETLSSIAKTYGVGISTIHRIKQGESWRHITQNGNESESVQCAA